MNRLISVAMPVRNGGLRLHEVLAAVRAQRVDREVELVVADSGSTDGSIDVAGEHGADVLTIPPGTFSHDGTRNHNAPEAAVVHSLEYALGRWFQRVFDEFRVLRDVFGHRVPLSPGLISAYQPRRKLGRSAGTDADRLAADLRGRSSLEGRTSFEPTALS